MLELLSASDLRMKFIASLLILLGLFILIWSVSEAMFSLNGKHISGHTSDNSFGSPWSGFFLIAIGGSLFIYLRKKIR